MKTDEPLNTSLPAVDLVAIGSPLGSEVVVLQPVGPGESRNSNDIGLQSQSVLASDHKESATTPTVDPAREISSTQELPSTSASLKTSTFYHSPIANSSSPVAVLIRDIHPLPKAAPRIRKRKAEAAEILTSSPYKANLLDKENSRKTPRPPQPKTSELRDSRKTKNCSGSKKKLPVRQDKPRGRRPDTQKSVAKTLKMTPERAKCNQPKSKRKVAEIDGHTECCGGCGESFIESTDDWLQCRRCGLWFEMTCVGMLGKSKAVQDMFLCDQCS